MPDARLLGKTPLPVFESPDAKKRTFVFLFSTLARRPRVGPLLDIPLMPGARSALAITRKDGR
jgi:hypothetical protein